MFFRRDFFQFIPFWYAPHDYEGSWYGDIAFNSFLSDTCIFLLTDMKEISIFQFIPFWYSPTTRSLSSSWKTFNSFLSDTHYMRTTLPGRDRDFQFIPFWYGLPELSSCSSQRPLSIHSFLIHERTARWNILRFSELSIHSFLILSAWGNRKWSPDELFQFIPFWYSMELTGLMPSGSSFNSFLSDTGEYKRNMSNLVSSFQFIPFWYFGGKLLRFSYEDLSIHSFLIPISIPNL